MRNVWTKKKKKKDINMEVLENTVQNELDIKKKIGLTC